MRTFKFKAVSVVISMALALALPFGVMAADFTDGAAIDAEWDTTGEDWDSIQAPVGVEDAFAPVDDSIFGFGDVDAFVSADADPATSKPATVITNVKFYWKDAKYPDRTVTFDRALVDDKTQIVDTEVVYGQLATIITPGVAPTCTEYGKFKMEITITGEATDVQNGYYVSEEFEDPTQPPTGHTWEGPKITTGNGDLTCESNAGTATYDYYCKNCDAVFSQYVQQVAEEDLTADEKAMKDKLENVPVVVTGHKYKEETWYMLPGVDELPNKDTLTKDKPDADEYYIVTVEVCQNVTDRDNAVTKCEVPVKVVTIARNDDTVKKVEIVEANNILADSFKEIVGEDKPAEDDENGVVVDYPFSFNPSELDLEDCGKDGSLKVKFIFDEPKTWYASKTGQVYPAEENASGDAAIKDAVDACLKDYKDKNEALEVPVAKHHTLTYTYQLADTKLEGTVDDYVIIVGADGKEVKVTDEKGEPIAFEKALKIKSSRYCKDYDVLVKAVCTCAKHEPKNTPVSTETVTAKAIENHLINKATRDDILSYYLDDKGKADTLKDYNDNVDTNKDGGLDLNEYEAFLKDRSKYIVEVSNTATCTKTGTAVVKYICTLCGKELDQTAEMFIDSFAESDNTSHKWEAQTPVEVDSTCTEKGSITFTSVCSRCGETKSRTLTLAKKAHNFSTTPVIEWEGNVVVDDNDGSLLDKGVNGKGKPGAVFDNEPIGEWWHYPEYLRNGAHFAVFPVVKLVCQDCGHEVTFPIAQIDNNAAYEYKITNEGAVKEGSFCQQGTINVSAEIKVNGGKIPVEAEDNNGIAGKTVNVGTATKKITGTFPYYSSMEAYQGRTAHMAGDPIITRVEPTETEAGYVDEVAYCRVCGELAYSRHTVLPALGHTHTIQHVDAKEATCTEAGNIEYWYCETCGLKFSDEANTVQVVDADIAIEALGHDITAVEAQEPTCEAGHIAYYVCNRCGKKYRDQACSDELDEEDIEIAPTADHTPGEAKNEVRDDGVYTVVYCEVCGIELSAEPYQGEEAAPLEAPENFKVEANKPAKGYMDFTMSEVEGAEKYRISYRVAGTEQYTRQESDKPEVRVKDLERGQIYDFTACAGDVVEGKPIKWGARVRNADGSVKYQRRWYETVEQSKIAKEGTVITLEWTALEDASKYVISIADNKKMKNAVKVNAAAFNPTVVDGKVQVSADITTLPGFDAVPEGSQIKFYVRIRPYTEYDGKNVAGALSNLRARTIKF